MFLTRIAAVKKPRPTTTRKVAARWGRTLALSSLAWLLLSVTALPAAADNHGASENVSDEISEGVSEEVVEQALVPAGAAPVRIAIPSISVSANVVPVGLDATGAMAGPDNPDEVAWYSLGPGVGVPGNAVLAGHVDWAGSYRVFGLLSWVHPGEDLAVWDSAGKEYRFIVESAQWINADTASVEAIFGQGDDSEVTLITCGGVFDFRRREYLDRFVVRARAV